MILEISNLKKSYKQVNKELIVLEKLDFSIEQPKTIAILGKSGSGKSTLLSLLGGLDTPDSGDIKIADHSLLAKNEKDLAIFRSKHIGIIFQEFHLLKNFTALENVMLPLEIFGDPKAMDKAQKALELVELKERADHFPHELSGGESQRVAIARAIVTEPNIILADEPSGNLDNETGDTVMNMIFALCKKINQTLILVTHDKELATRCDEVYELKNKRLEKQ
jgi:predicted ABC-type transport system involved in lysophospholipase L1 biosynthesis ATPase subunit